MRYLLRILMQPWKQKIASRVLRTSRFFYKAVLFLNSPRSTDVELTRYCLKSFREVEHLGALVPAV